MVDLLFLCASGRIDRRFLWEVKSWHQICSQSTFAPHQHVPQPITER